MSAAQEIKMDESNADFREEVKEILLRILAAMLNHSEKVQIDVEVGSKTTVFKVHCDPQDYGQLLGRGGRNIDRAFAVSTTAMMAKYGCRAVVEVPYIKKNNEEI